MSLPHRAVLKTEVVHFRLRALAQTLGEDMTDIDWSPRGGALSYTLSEALEIVDLTPDEARREIEKHEASWTDFLAEIGEKNSYTGEEVLGWLGY